MASILPALAFVNADLGAAGVSTLRTRGSEITQIGGRPSRRDRVIDLHGDRLLPGLINAHDHLQLNSFELPEYRSSYRNAGDWISDLNTRLSADERFASANRVPRSARLLAGGLKNLLSGVTTVAHHDPLYPDLTSPAFPVRVVSRYGWAHSLAIEGEAAVQRSYRDTPADRAWIIHAAEGVDEVAGSEAERLDRLGCLGPNTLLVHGVALEAAQRRRVLESGAGLIWCPVSNLRLFGQTAQTADFAARGRLALGSDSRLTGSRDLLEELRIAAVNGQLGDAALEQVVTSSAARLLRLSECGTLAPGYRADLLVIPARRRLTTVQRSEVRLVMLDGVARYGDEEYVQRAAPDGACVPVWIDGQPKCLDRRVAGLLAGAPIIEPGLELPRSAAPRMPSAGRSLRARSLS